MIEHKSRAVWDALTSGAKVVPFQDAASVNARIDAEIQEREEKAALDAALDDVAVDLEIERSVYFSELDED
jgi:hypothetical protein